MTWHVLVASPPFATVRSSAGECLPRALLLCSLCPFLQLPHTHTTLLLKSSTPICFVLTHSEPNPLLLLHFLLPVLSVTSIMASRAVLLLAMCVLPAMVVAIRPAKSPFSVKGRVYCDRCRAGFETSATTYIAGNSYPLSLSLSFLKH